LISEKKTVTIVSLKLLNIQKGTERSLSLVNKIKAGFSSYICHTDWLLVLACTAASGYGLALVYSAVKTAGAGYRDFIIQLAACIVGLIVAMLISKIDYDIICKLWPVLSGISLILVLLTFTPLGLEVADDKAWLSIPIIGTFQPSELLKITFIISFAAHLSKVHERLNEISVLIPVCIHGLIPAGLIFLQGDDGTAIVFLCIFVTMLFIAGLKPLYLILAFTGVAGAVPVVWQMMSDDKRNRFLSLIFVEQYAKNTGWQQQHALVSIGSGRLWGVGYIQGGDNYLYARNNDFIFTVAGEEFGFIGGLLLLALIVLVVLALLRQILKARDLQGMLLCGGIMAMIGFQSLINLGMNLRLLPVIGITLPFFSKGGSSIATLFLGIGVALSVYYSSNVRSRDSIFSNRLN